MASRTLTVTDNMTERQRNAFASPITIWEDYTENPWPFRRVCRWRRDSTRYLAAHHVIPRNEGGAEHREPRSAVRPVPRARIGRRAPLGALLTPGDPPEGAPVLPYASSA
jgi:hypothetical protein